MDNVKSEVPSTPLQDAVHLKPVGARALSAAFARQQVVPVVIDGLRKRAASTKGQTSQSRKHAYLLLDANISSGSGGGPHESFMHVIQAVMDASRRHGTGWVLKRLEEKGSVVHRDGSQDSPGQGQDWRAKEAENWKRVQAGFFQAHRSVTAPELADLTNSRAANRSARAHDWAKAGKVFSVNDGTTERFPVFQLRDGAPNPVIGRVLAALGGKLTPWQVAMWLTTPNAEFADWQTPLDRIDAEPDAVVAAARREAEAAVF